MAEQTIISANQSNFLSRNDMLNWINEQLKLNEKKIENLGTGAVYCQLLDFCHPGKVQMSKVNWRAKNDYEFVSNFKVLQQGFDKLKITKPIDINKLIKCKYSDNLEFLQWLKKYFDQHYKQQPYDPIARRGGYQPSQDEKVSQLGYSYSINLDTSANSSLRNTMQSKHSTYFKAPAQYIKTVDTAKSQNSISNISIDQDYAENNKLQREFLMDKLREERDFYFSKLKDIDQFLDQISPAQNSVLDVKKFIKTILYTTPDQLLIIDDDGKVQVKDKQGNNVNLDNFQIYEGLEQLKQEILNFQSENQKMEIYSKVIDNNYLFSQNKNTKEEENFSPIKHLKSAGPLSSFANNSNLTNGSAINNNYNASTFAPQNPKNFNMSGKDVFDLNKSNHNSEDSNLVDNIEENLLDTQF